MTLARPTINCDMGEGFGLYQCGDDEGVIPFVTMINVACGFHASDPVVMRRTVALAKRYQVRVGAHPSYPDLQGFGRREMKMEREELSACLLYQVGALKAFLDAERLPLSHVKPHGALYGVAARDEVTAQAIVDVAKVFGVPLLGMADTALERAAKAKGVGFMAEFFADREYGDDGALIITRRSHAVDPRQAARRVARMVSEGKVRSVNGLDVSVRADSICVHSETPDAVELARAVHGALGNTDRVSASH